MQQFGLFEERPHYRSSLQEVVDELMALRDDPLAAEGTNMVIYRGNPAAKLMVIGEAPGPEEDKQGKPFVGRSGQLLDKMLEAGGFSQDDVFISNAVFRLPPGQDGKAVRKPTPEEIEYYRPYILDIIRLIDPKVILLSGAVAAQSILDEKLGITKIRGKWYHWHDKWVMPIFHPAYLLRNPSRDPGSPKSLTWADIKEVRRKYEEVVKKPGS